MWYEEWADSATYTLDMNYLLMGLSSIGIQATAVSNRSFDILLSLEASLIYFQKVSKKYFYCTFLLNVYNTIADIITINPAGNEFTFLNHYWLERTLLSSFLLEILYSVPVNSTLHPADSISQVYRLTSLDQIDFSNSISSDSINPQNSLFSFSCLIVTMKKDFGFCLVDHKQST